MRGRRVRDVGTRRNVGTGRRRLLGRGAAGGLGKSATVGALCEAMEKIAPCWAAAEWDNVGLLAGSRAWPARRILLTIDLTAAVLDEAIGGRYDAIVAYHPPIFRPIKRMIAERGEPDGLAAAALALRVAVYSPHTALDAAPGGTNDALAELAGLTETIPFEAAAAPARECKLVTFVPQEQLERVAEAVFAAGAGRIGAYEKCSFRIRGEGTFFGTESTDPVVGRKGRLERVEETRLEVVLPRALIADVTAALRRAHPYEEPAFDLYPLASAPDGRVGQGRIGRFEKAVSVGALARTLWRKTRAANVVVVGKASQRMRRGLVCAGAAGSLPFEMPGEPCGAGDVVIPGEIRHHDALRYQRCGAAAVALGHWASERPVLTPLAIRLRKVMPKTAFVVSRMDRDPFGAI